MTMTMVTATIDCAEPKELAGFWTAALDYEIKMDMQGFFVLLGPRSGEGTAIGLQKVDEPKAGKNRMHLDFTVDDRLTEVARLVGLGATEHEEHAVPGLTWTVLTDPVGNEFCVGSPNG
jgi:predicted enzyme related to lactoylglutathione lyase